MTKVYGRNIRLLKQKPPQQNSPLFHCLLKMFSNAVRRLALGNLNFNKVNKYIVQLTNCEVEMGETNKTEEEKKNTLANIQIMRYE